MERTELRARARIAYELGRARIGIQAMGGAGLLAAAALALGRPFTQVALLAAFLLPLSGGLAFRGRAAGRAVWPGLAAGGIAMLLPLTVVVLGHNWLGPDCMRFCLPACVVGGSVSGAVMASLATRQRDGESEFILGGITVAALAASLGCALAGSAGLAGMALGTVLAGTPVWIAGHARR